MEPMNDITLKLTAAELDALYWLLVDTAHQVDDDGNEGAFDASPLKPIYDKVRFARAEDK